LSPQNEGEYVMIKIPTLTQDRRSDITKKVKTMWEESKAQIRQIRQDAMKTTKKLLDDKEISEDQNKINESNIDWLVKNANTQIDNLVKAKSEEVMKL
jgi:ribosome recycling factor